MKERYELAENMYFENMHKKDEFDMYIFDLVFEYPDEKKRYQCHFKSEMHLLDFIRQLNSRPEKPIMRL